MEWISAVAIFTIVSGLTIAVVVLMSLATLRRHMDEAVTHQTQQVKRLAEAVAALNQQHQAAQAKVLALTEANRKLADQVAALTERVGDADGTSRPSGLPRLLH